MNTKVIQFVLLFFASFSFIKSNACGFTLSSSNFIVLSPTCYGLPNGSIQVVNLVGGVTPYTYTLANGTPQLSNTFINLVGNTFYWVKVQDATLCTDSFQVFMNEPPPIFISTTVTNATCNNSDGIICVTINGGLPPYTVITGGFNNTSSTNTYCTTGLPLGLYNTFVLDAMGCNSINTIMNDSIAPSSLGNLGATVTSTVIDETCYHSGDGGINVTVNPSTGISYLWNTGATSQDAFNLMTGSYYEVISSSPNDCIVLSNQVNFTGTNCGTIGGKVFIDSNSNCTYGVSDFPVRNVLMNLSNGALALTNPTGDYFFNAVPLGNVTVNQNLPNANYFVNSCTQPSVINVTTTSGAIPQDFKDSTIYACDAWVYTYMNYLVPGTSSDAHIHVRNLQNYINCGGSLSYVLPSPLVYTSSTPSATVYPVASGDSLVWNFASITINNSYWGGDIYTVNFNSPTNLTLGNSYTGCANVVLSGTDIDVSNNAMCFTRTVTSSFDPNDKSVSPVGIGTNGGITKKDSVLNYMIRFQNTGTASATNIVILDTISSKVNINTLEITESSHNYNIEILNGNVLQIKFKNINLPDSNANEPLSHGFISYKIHQKATNVIGDQIKNSASIYFDYNIPVLTNTTLNTIIAPLNTSSIKTDMDVKVYPSPANNQLNIVCSNLEHESIRVEISNSLGQQLISNSYSSDDQIYINTTDLCNGLYILKITRGTTTYSNKVSIQH